MKTCEVRVDQNYYARISGRIVPIRVLHAVDSRRGVRGGIRKRWMVRNLITNREIVMTAARIRETFTRS